MKTGSERKIVDCWVILSLLSRFNACKILEVYIVILLIL